jgi:hypothetical protein
MKKLKSNCCNADIYNDEFPDSRGGIVFIKQCCKKCKKICNVHIINKRRNK